MTQGKKPPAPSATERGSFTLLLRKTSAQTRIEGLDPKFWDDVVDDYAIIDGETKVGRIYRFWVHGTRKWQWSLQTDPAPTPNIGIADSLEECKADFKKRYALIRDTHGPHARRPPQI